MGAAAPRMHGRTHIHGGPDPSMLAYEITDEGGTPGSGSFDPWSRYAIVQGSSLVAASGEVRVLWASVFGYSPEGALCDLAAAGGAPAGHHVRLLQIGFYDLKIRLFSSSLVTPVYAGWGIAGNVVEYGSNLVATQHALAGGSTGYPYVQFNTQLTTGAAVPDYFRFQTPGATPPSWTGFTAVALVTRLSPTAA